MRQAALLNNARYWLGKKRPPHTAEALAKIAAAHKGRIRPLEEKEKISATLKAIMTPEMRQARSDSLRSRKVSDETKAKISAKHLGMKHKPESRAKMSKSKKALHLTHGPEWRSAQSARLKGRPAYYPKQRTYYKGAPMRSSWEKRAAVAFDALGMKWTFESRRFDLGVKTYTPDFYLPEDNCYWEIKGFYRLRDQETTALFREQYPEIPLVLCTEKVLIDLERSAARVVAPVAEMMVSA